MDIQDLNKPQLVLLAVLVSFVTSIATGITTVTLMEQAPPGVVQPINRIIQKTIEKIVPSSGDKEVKTIVVKEEDLVVDAIEMTFNNTVLIKEESKSGEGTTEPTLKDWTNGLLVYPNFILTPDTKDLVLENKYYFDFKDKKIGIGSGKIFDGFSILNLNKNDSKGLSFSKVGSEDNIKTGQSIILVNIGKKSIYKGTILGLTEKELTKADNSEMAAEVIASTEGVNSGAEISTAVPEKIKIINTSLSLTKSNIGNLAINLNGEIIGIVVEKNGEIIILPVGVISEALLKT